jgi:cardiolipin synthase
MLILSHFLTVLGFVLCVLLINRLFRAHQTPEVTLAWLLAIVLIPYVGLPAVWRAQTPPHGRP